MTDTEAALATVREALESGAATAPIGFLTDIQLALVALDSLAALLAKLEQDAPPTAEEWHAMCDRAEAAERERDLSTEVLRERREHIEALEAALREIRDNPAVFAAGVAHRALDGAESPPDSGRTSEPEWWRLGLWRQTQ